MKTYTLFAFLITASLSFAQEFKIALKENSQFLINTEINVLTSYELGGNNMENNVRKLLTRSVTVNSKPGTQIMLTDSTKRLQVQLKANGQEVAYDSDKKDNPLIMEEAFGSQSRSVLQTTLDEHGNRILLNSTVPNSLLHIDMMSGSLANGNIYCLHTPLSGRDMAEGSKWFDSLTMKDEKASHNLSGSYKVKENSNDKIIIAFEGIQKSKGLTSQMGQDINMTGECIVSATFTADSKSGLVISYTATYDGTIYLDMAAVLIPVTVKIATRSDVSFY